MLVDVPCLFSASYLKISCVQVLLTHDGNFRLRAKGYDIPVCKFETGTRDGEVQMPVSRQELLERFFPDVISAPQQVPPCCGFLWPLTSACALKGMVECYQLNSSACTIEDCIGSLGQKFGARPVSYTLHKSKAMISSHHTNVCRTSAQHSWRAWRATRRLRF